MEMLYHSVSDLVRLANEHQIPLWKVVLLADVQERQVTVEESFETMRQMYQAMRQADQEYDGSIVSASGMAGGDGEKLHAYNASGRSLAGEYMGLVMEKAVKMADMMDIPVLGIVENMSYFKCPDCGNIHYIYGKSKIDEVAAANDIKTVAKLPMDAKVAGLVDSGKAEELDVSALDGIFDAIMA